MPVDVVDNPPRKALRGRAAAAESAARHGHSTDVRGPERSRPRLRRESRRHAGAFWGVAAASISASVRSVANDLYAYSGAAAKMTA